MTEHMRVKGQTRARVDESSNSLRVYESRVRAHESLRPNESGRDLNYLRVHESQ